MCNSYLRDLNSSYSNKPFSDTLYYISIIVNDLSSILLELMEEELDDRKQRIDGKDL